MPVYRTKGTLTHAIPDEGIAQAQEYLRKDHEGKPINMAQFIWDDEPFKDAIEYIEWDLVGGFNWTVTAYSNRELSDDELKKLSGWVSGQNSDGLGEGFEQQDFAWIEEEDEQNCGQCDGGGYVQGDDGLEDCPECDGAGYFTSEGGHMCSFDWKTNDCKFERIG